MNPTIYVVADFQTAAALQKQLGPADRSYRVMYPGSGVTGYRAERIIVSNAVFDAINDTEAGRKWWDERVLTRLGYQGELILL